MGHSAYQLRRDAAFKTAQWKDRQSAHQRSRNRHGVGGKVLAPVPDPSFLRDHRHASAHYAPKVLAMRSRSSELDSQLLRRARLETDGGLAQSDVEHCWATNRLRTSALGYTSRAQMWKNIDTYIFICIRICVKTNITVFYTHYDFLLLSFLWPALLTCLISGTSIYVYADVYVHTFSYLYRICICTHHMA